MKTFETQNNTKQNNEEEKARLFKKKGFNLKQK